MRRHLWHDNARNHEINLIRFGSKKFYCDRDGGCDYCNQEDQIGVIAKETHAKASLVCPSVTVELIGGGGFKPSSQRNQNKSKVGHIFDLDSVTTPITLIVGLAPLLSQRASGKISDRHFHQTILNLAQSPSSKLCARSQTRGDLCAEV